MYCSSAKARPCTRSGTDVRTREANCLWVLSAVDGCGQYHLVMSGMVIRCPWHNWEFDVTQGSCLDPSVNSKVATYQTEVEEGQIFILM